MNLKYCQILLILILGSCSLKNKSTRNIRPNPKSIEITEIICKNLSEDMSILSTHNDEILLKIDEISCNYKTCKIINEIYRNTITFKNRDEIFEIDKAIAVNNKNHQLIISLFELDNNDSENKVIELSDMCIRNRKFHQEEVNLIKIDSIFGHDDLLGIEILNFDKNNFSTKNKIVFKGFQLFDKYEYILNYELY